MPAVVHVPVKDEQFAGPGGPSRGARGKGGFDQLALRASPRPRRRPQHGGAAAEREGLGGGPSQESAARQRLHPRVRENRQGAIVRARMRHANQDCAHDPAQVKPGAGNYSPRPRRTPGRAPGRSPERRQPKVGRPPGPCPTRGHRVSRIRTGQTARGSPFARHSPGRPPLPAIGSQTAATEANQPVVRPDDRAKKANREGNSPVLPGTEARPATEARTTD